MYLGWFRRPSLSLLELKSALFFTIKPYTMQADAKVDKLTIDLFYREFLASLVLNQSVTTLAARLPLVNKAAPVVKCVTSTKEDSIAHVRQDTLDTGAKPRFLLDPVKMSCCLEKWKRMVSTTFRTNIKSHSQFTVTLILNLVSRGPWSSLTPCKTRMHSRKPSICTTCQSTKMHPNGTTTACQCPVWSLSEMSPLTGEPLVIFPPMESIFEITFALRSLKATCLRFLVQTDALGMSLLTFEETSAPNVLLSRSTVTNTVITSTVGIAKLFLAVISMEDLTGEFRAKTTSASTLRQILLSDAVLWWRLQLSIGLVVLDMIPRNMFRIPKSSATTM